NKPAAVVFRDHLPRLSRQVPCAFPGIGIEDRRERHHIEVIWRAQKHMAAAGGYLGPNRQRSRRNVIETGMPDGLHIRKPPCADATFVADDDDVRLSID